jgi:hypothetical protein
MGLTYNSGITSVTGNVSVTTTSALPAPGASQTMINYSSGRAGTSWSSSPATLYTVTNGKKFYLMGFSCSGPTVASDFTDNGTVKFAIPTGSTILNGGGAPIAVFSTSVQAVATSGSGTPVVNFWGFEQ